MPDWSAVFVPAVPVLEVVVRGTLVLLALTVMLWVAGQREAGGLGITDLLVVVLVATAVGDGMGGGLESVTEALVLVGTILLWSVALDAATYRVPLLRRLLKAHPRPLIEGGRPNDHVLRREFLNREELESQLRLHGVRDISDVTVAYLEPNGMISVFRSDDEGRSEGTEAPPRPPEV